MMQERTEVLLDRYLYLLTCRGGAWYVTCRDIHITVNELEHGPFSEEAARAMIDSRIQRYEDLKRD